MTWNSEYATIRSRNLQIQRTNRQAAISKCPDLLIWEGKYLAAQRKRAYAARNAARADANNNKIIAYSDDASVENEIKTLLSERAVLLKQHGFPENYLDLAYDCENCHDYAYIDGKPCACLEKRRFASRTKQSNLMGFEKQVFENFDESIIPLKDGQREKTLKIRNASRQFADNFPDTKHKNMLFMGTSGLGKTFLLHCIGRTVLDRGFSVCKITSSQFHQLIMGEVIGNKNLFPYHVLEQVDLLLFDDLGTEPSTAKGIVAQHFFALLTERSESEKAIVTATNCTLLELGSRYGERTASRLLDKRKTGIFHFFGQDLRICEEGKHVN